jgi:hypothetical protein
MNLEKKMVGDLHYAMQIAILIEGIKSKTTK